MIEKQERFASIDADIKNDGFHITLVSSNLEPRYAYTIGLNELLGFELVFSGGARFYKRDLSIIFKTIIDLCKKSPITINQTVDVPSLGSFSFAAVHLSWSKLMMLGVFDYYKLSEISAFQIIPDAGNFTLDIPDMAKAFVPEKEPVWKWLVKEWNYPAPQNSTVTTNLNALAGETITELTRWEENEWEMFAGPGPDVTNVEMRVVSLATILGIDKSLLPSIYLELGKGLWRDSEKSEWNSWG